MDWGDIESVFLLLALTNITRYMAVSQPASTYLTDKLVYSAEILLIAVLALSKLSTALLILELSPRKDIQRAALVTLCVIGVWTAFAILGDILQCGVPDPWVCPGKVRRVDSMVDEF